MHAQETDLGTHEERDGRAGEGAPRTAVVDGARVAYWQAGPPDGEPILLLHGYPANHLCWRHQIPALARTHRVIAPDLLGWGASDHPFHLSFDYDTEVARVGRLLDALGIDSVNLFGHDYGGFLALGFTQTHPGRVRRLALLNSRAHASFTTPWYTVFTLLTLTGRAPALRVAARRLPFTALHRSAFKPLLRDGHLDEATLASYTDWMRTTEGSHRLLHFFSHYRTAPRPELRHRAAGITCPTAIVWGRQDTYLSPRIATDLAARIPTAELTMLDDAGHWLLDSHPDTATAALSHLLTRPT
ncbi:alpha/beta hydrolase [Streptomyces griseoviridis]|uniref:Hydrolase n=1 Tax=Streptomyces griseoviridis TaxID=45398 RepID=A0A918G3P3_STRGD|nr:alpha/beta hydrolase [Streptomyces niveoruber]GGS16690.1 hydrolase [Streptomyces niveoruber]